MYGTNKTTFRFEAVPSAYFTARTGGVSHPVTPPTPKAREPAAVGNAAARGGHSQEENWGKKGVPETGVCWSVEVGLCLLPHSRGDRGRDWGDRRDEGCHLAASCPRAAHLGCAQSLPPPGAQELAEGPTAPHLPHCEELGGTGWTGCPQGCTRKELGDVPCAHREGAGHQQAGKCRASCPGGKHPETTTPKPRGMGREGCGCTHNLPSRISPSAARTPLEFYIYSCFFLVYSPFFSGVFASSGARAEPEHPTGHPAAARPGEPQGCPPPSATLAQGHREP